MSMESSYRQDNGINAKLPRSCGGVLFIEKERSPHGVYHMGFNSLDQSRIPNADRAHSAHSHAQRGQVVHLDLVRIWHFPDIRPDGECHKLLQQ